MVNTVMFLNMFLFQFHIFLPAKVNLCTSILFTQHTFYNRFIYQGRNFFPQKQKILFENWHAINTFSIEDQSEIGFWSYFSVYK